MAEITDRAFSTEDVAQEPAGQGRPEDQRPEDPSLSSEASIKSKLTAQTGVAAGMSFGAEEPTPIASATEALSALTAVVTSQDARTAALTGELAVNEVQGALDRGLPAEDVLGAALSSGAVDRAAVDEWAWRSALAEHGLDSDEDLVAIDDDELDAQVEQRYEQILGQASALAHQQDTQRVYQETYSTEFAQGIKNHEASIQALRDYQREAGLDGPTMEALLVGIDAELQGGILGQPLDLDQLAITDPKLFAASLRSVGSTILEGFDQEDAHALKQRILAQERDISSGLTIDGQAVREPPSVEVYGDKFPGAVARRAKKGPYDGSVNLPATRSIMDGFTSDGRKVHPDDLPIGDKDGGTARTRLKAALRGDKP